MLRLRHRFQHCPRAMRYSSDYAEKTRRKKRRRTRILIEFELTKLTLFLCGLAVTLTVTTWIDEERERESPNDGSGGLQGCTRYSSTLHYPNGHCFRLSVMFLCCLCAPKYPRFAPLSVFNISGHKKLGYFVLASPFMSIQG